MPASGSGGKQRRKWMDWCSTERAKEIISHRITNNTKIGNSIL